MQYFSDTPCWRSCHPFALKIAWKRKKRGNTLLACSTSEGLRTAHQVRTSNYEAHADIWQHGKRHAEIYPVSIYRCIIPRLDWKCTKFSLVWNKAPSKRHSNMSSYPPTQAQGSVGSKTRQKYKFFLYSKEFFAQITISFHHKTFGKPLKSPEKMWKSSVL